jgi:alpha-beta hydrolase superfamily lysophospholipase
MTRSIQCVVLVGLLVVLPRAGAGQRGATAGQMITLHTEDGVSIAAELRPSATGRPSPAVILVHMLTRTHEDWRGLADRLSEAGLAVLAIDLRGHGASGTAAILPADPDDMTASLLDVKAARMYLRGRPDLWSGAIGMAGAQVGANLVVMEAASDPLVRSIALLSPGMDYRRLRPEAAMKRYDARPALILASTEDAYASRSARELAGIGTGVRDLRIVNGAGHGTVMLTRQPGLVAALVDWFRRTLL